MRAVLFIILFNLSLTLPARPASAARSTNSADFTAIDSFIETEMNAANIPGLSLAIVQGDQIVYLKGYGVANPEGQPVTPQTPFMIASTVKPFTALSIMQLVEAGQVELDVPVQHYLPWFRMADTAASGQITVRHLLNHTSGLSEASGNEFPVISDLDAVALEDRVRRLRSVQLNRPVGTRFEYSSANYDILGLIVQTVSEQPYETYLEEHIFAPLEMRRTYTSSAEAEQHGLATGYRSWFGIPVSFAGLQTRAYVPSGWTISSNAEDLAHFAVAQLNSGLYENESSLGISPEGLTAMHQPAVPAYNETTFYGAGWNMTTMSGVPVIWAGGDAANFKARLVLATEEQLGVVLLVNMNSVNVNSGRFDIHRGILNMLLGQQPAPNTASHFMPIYIPFIVVLVVAMLFLVDTIRQLIKRRQRISPPATSPKGKGLLLKLCLPVILVIFWALLLLIGLPLVSGRSLSFILHYIPDFGFTLIISSVLALCWGLVRVIGLANGSSR